MYHYKKKHYSSKNMLVNKYKISSNTKNRARIMESGGLKETPECYKQGIPHQLKSSSDIKHRLNNSRVA